MMCVITNREEVIRRISVSYIEFPKDLIELIMHVGVEDDEDSLEVSASKIGAEQYVQLDRVSRGRSHEQGEALGGVSRLHGLSVISRRNMSSRDHC